MVLTVLSSFVKRSCLEPTNVIGALQFSFERNMLYTAVNPRLLTYFTYLSNYVHAHETPPFIPATRHTQTVLIIYFSRVPVCISDTMSYLT